jgi:hypothetical protein
LSGVFPELRVPSPGQQILSDNAYDRTRVLNGTTVHNVHEVILNATGIPTSFALSTRHEEVEEGTTWGQFSLLGTILPFVEGFSRVGDLGEYVPRLRRAILAGSPVPESAKWYDDWTTLQNNSIHVKVAPSAIAGHGEDGLWWKEEMQGEKVSFPQHSPLYVYGGVECTDPKLLEVRAQDYLLHVPGGLPYICGQPWEHMPPTHVGGYACHDGAPCTVIRWIPMSHMLPFTIVQQLKDKGLLRVACEGLAVPIVYSSSRQPEGDSELTMKYGAIPEFASPGIARVRAGRAAAEECAAAEAAEEGAGRAAAEDNVSIQPLM